MTRALLGALLLAGGCAPDLTPARATDTMWFEPSGDGATGFVTWNVYGPGFARRGSDRHHICAVVQAVDLAPSATPCPTCQISFDVTSTTPVEGDCEGFDLPSELTLAGVGFGPLDSELTSEEPWPEAEGGSWVRYADGSWTAHGWALPEGAPSTAAPWDGASPLTAWPAWAVVLD